MTPASIAELRPSDVVLAGAGMVTSVGLSVAECAASVRSATMRFSESAIHDKRFEPFTLAEIPADALPPLAAPLEETLGLTSRVMRMLRLAHVALAEAVSPLTATAPKPGLLLSLPETETTIPLDDEAIVRQLGAQAGDYFDAKYASAHYRGRAGGLEAIGRAVDLVRSGDVPYMLAGGVDTYRDLYVLGTLDMEGRVKSNSSMDGFIPGEGVAVVLVANGEACARFSLAPKVLLSDVQSSEESGHFYSSEPYRGDGLSAAVRKVWDSGVLKAPAGEVWSTMNGESHWGKEWGVAYLRNRPMFAEDHGMQHPADCYGDTGAASGAALVILAAEGILGGYRRSPALVYGSNDRAGRAAMVVQRVGGTEA